VFSVTTIAGSGAPLTSDVVAGGQEPPRGWLSRYYGEKVPVPSLAAVREAPLPMTLLSVLCPGRPVIHVDHDRFDVACAAARVRFQIDDGRIAAVDVIDVVDALAPAPRRGITP